MMNNELKLDIEQIVIVQGSIQFNEYEGINSRRKN